MHTYTGVPASTGIVVGPVEQIDHGTTGLHRIVCDPFRERALYDVAVVLAKDELRRLSQRAKGPDADILLFQIALLEDESFTNEIGDYIAAGAGGAAAVERAEQIFAGRLKNVDDEYIRERSVDVCDVCRRVVDILDGRPRRRLHLKRPSILVADRFFPSDLFSLDRRMILGLASNQDSTISHAAIMARSMGLPAVLQLGDGVAALAAGKRAILDANLEDGTGSLIVDPDGAHIAQADCKIALNRLHGSVADPVAAQPCLTRDGTAFRLLTMTNLYGTEDKALPELTEGQALPVAGAAVKEGKTTPPKHFTEDTLLSAMETAGKDDMPEDAERKGLGTPATRAGILEKLVSTGFLERKKSKKTVQLLPSHDAISLITVLPEQLQSPLLTAEWEYRLGEIERGELAPEDFMAEITAMLKELVGTYQVIKGSEYLFAPPREVVGKCPRCGGEIAEMQKGFFCQDQSCKFAIWKNNNWWAAKRKQPTKAIVAALLKDGRAHVTGLYSEKSGKTYDATVVLEDTGQYVNFKLEFDRQKGGGK